MVLMGFIGLYLHHRLKDPQLAAQLITSLIKPHVSLRNLLLFPKSTAPSVRINSREQLSVPSSGILDEIIGLVLVSIAALGVIGSSAPISTYRIQQNDSSIFAYIGNQILDGKLLYSQLFDHKPPLIYYLNAFGLWLNDGSFWGVWLIELTFILVSVWLVYRFLNMRFGLVAAFTATFAGVFNLVSPLEGGNLTEEYGILFQVLVISLIFFDPYPKITSLRLFSIGILGGLLFLTKPNLIGIWIALGLFVLLKSVPLKAFKLVLLFAGFVVPNLIVIIGFLMQGNANDYLWAAYSYNFIYSGGGSINLFDNFLNSVVNYGSLGLFYLAAFLVWASLLVYKITILIRSGGKPILSDHPISIQNFLVVYFPIELLFANFSGQSYNHYYLSLWVCSVMLIAEFIRLTAQWITHSRFIRFLPPAFLAASLITPVVMLVEIYPLDNEITVTQTVEYINGHAGPSDTLYVFGMEPIIYFRTNLSSPSRFFTHFDHLNNPDYFSESHVREFTNDLLQNPPTFLVDIRRKYSPTISFESDGGCTYRKSPLYSSLNQLFEYICGNYSLVDTVGKEKWLIYRLKE